MVQYLGNMLEDFPGPANQTRCFVHTINLIVKSILRPFDAQKTNDIQAFNDALADLAEEDDLDIFTDHTTDATDVVVDGEVNEGDAHQEDHDVDASLGPISSTLLKVCSHSIDCNTWLRHV